MDFFLFSERGIMFLMRWAHFLSGITWIGILYYFNFVQGPFLAGVDEAATKKYVTTKLLPRALWWFRWGALATWLSGAWFLQLQGMLHQAFTLGLVGPSNPYATTIGVGAWLGTIMLINVWALIWPNQKKILGMVEATAEEVAKAKNIALLASRSNTLMSIPLVMSMVGPGHGWFM